MIAVERSETTTADVNYFGNKRGGLRIDRDKAMNRQTNPNAIHPSFEFKVKLLVQERKLFLRDAQ